MTGIGGLAALALTDGSLEKNFVCTEPDQTNECAPGLQGASRPRRERSCRVVGKGEGPTTPLLASLVSLAALPHSSHLPHLRIAAPGGIPSGVEGSRVIAASAGCRLWFSAAYPAGDRWR